MRKLNLGCGEDWQSYPEYVGLDIINFGQSYVSDVLNFFKANNEIWDEIMANHFLEHFSQDDLRTIFFSVWSRLKSGGVFKFVVPHKDKPKAWVLSHKTFWCEETVRWLEREDSTKVYGFGKWGIIELVVNDRKDIHVVLQKLL